MNSTNPTISIIIPIYNTEKYLRRCLDSIVAQTYKDFECIIVDDGSTDGSGKICDEYVAKDNRFKVFHKKNGGVSSARNLGLDNAKGEYIAFCDADDYVKENWLSEFILRIPICDIVVSGFEKTHCGKVQKKYIHTIIYLNRIYYGLYSKLMVPQAFYGISVLEQKS